MRKKIITTLGTMGSLTTVALLVVSCGTSNPSGLSKDVIAVAEYNGKTIGEIAYEKYMNDLLADHKTDTAKRVQDIVKKSAKWLYEKEVSGSEHMKKIREAQMTDDEIESANISTLDSVKKIEDRVKAEFEDQKEAFKNQHGHGYEEAWKKELATNASYDKATSDEQAIDNMVMKQLVNSAYNRYKIVQDESTFTKKDVERGNPANKNPNLKDWKWLWDLKQSGFVYSTDKTSTYDQLNDKQKVIVVSTGSFDVDLKNPTDIVGGKGKDGYLNKFDPMVINHFLLPAIPDEKNTRAPWKVKLEDAKKWLMSTEEGTPKASMDNITNFKGLTYKNVGKPNEEFNVSKEDEILLKTISGNQKSTQNTGGSLGLMDQLSYIKTMDPGFGLQILNGDIKPGEEFEIIKSNPLTGLSGKILNALQKEVDGSNWSNNSSSSEEWAEAIISLLDNIDEAKAMKIIGREFRNAFGVSNKKFKRYIAYEIGKNQYLVTTKFGVHIISERKITSKEEIISMLKSDVTRKTKGESSYFNVIKELSKYSSDKMMIVKSLLNNNEFVEWLKTQPNYNNIADGNDYHNYKQEDIDYLKQKAIKGYEQTLVASRVQESISNIKSYVDKSYLNEMLIAGGKISDDTKNPRYTNAMKNIYDAAIKIAKEGAIK